MNSNQQQVKKFIIENDLDTTIELRLLDLVSELGELSKEIVTGSNYGKTVFTQTSETMNELGDVYFSLIDLANKLNINLDDALKSVLNKYNTRINIAGTPGSK